jgi:hypothetical protein
MLDHSPKPIEANIIGNNTSEYVHIKLKYLSYIYALELGYSFVFCNKLKMCGNGHAYSLSTCW